LASSPNQPDALHYLGVALAQSGQFQEAVASLSQALIAQPNNAAAHIHYGNALAGLSRHAEALASYERAIALDTTLADAHYNRGVALAELGRHEAALASYEQAIARDPDHAQAHNNLGNLLSDGARYLEALQHYERASEIRTDFIDAWVNRANLLRRLTRYEKALSSSERAIQINPDHPQAHSSRGAVLASLGRYDEALSSYRRAIELKPDLAEGLWNKAIVHLSRGEWGEGWSLYEARWKVKSLGLTQHCADLPAWRGQESIQGKVVLLHAEQGYGDTLQFCRYASLVAARGARVILGVPSALQSLMRSLEGVAQVVTQGAPPPFDHHCPLLSLPLAFGTELASIPAPRRYLSADPGARARWGARLGPRTGPRIGLVWSGSATHTNDLNRSIALESVLPLTQYGAQFVSLQKEIRGLDAPAFARAPNIRRFGDELIDFADAAALVSELDLVISVDTSIAHLAGALGKPVWILLPYVADWRWLQEREDSPWYPSARLFRQPAARDWGSVIERLALALRQFEAAELDAAEAKSTPAKAMLLKLAMGQ
jgi:tetratricopeptide (TPR) repeat protein